MKSKNWIFAKRNKFNASTQTVDGITFHSKKEASYYQDLKLMKRAGEIKDFDRQVKFDLYAHNPKPWNVSGADGVTEACSKKVCAHIVDFLVTTKDGAQEVHEVKGFATDIWDLKRKIFEANYPNIPYKVVR